MSTDPALPPSLARRINELESRIRTLESSNRLQSSSIQGGSFSVLDATTGVESVRLGAHVTSDGANVAGISAAVPSTGLNTLWIDSVSGAVLPMFAVPFVGLAETATTSASFVNVWRAVSLKICSDAVSVWIPVRVDSGTVGEIRLSHTYSGTTSTSVRSITATTETMAIFDWKHGVPLRQDVTFTVDVRRVSGAGSVLSKQPVAGWFTGHQIYGADATGL